MDKLHLQLIGDKIRGEISLSGSKSISNRLLLMDQLSESNAAFINLSDSDDTLRIQKCLHEIEVCASSRIPLIVDAGNSGTVFRFLTAYLSIKNGKWFLTGDARMKLRPIDDLVNALNDIGAKINYTEKKNFPPLQIDGVGLNGSKVKVNASKSSQFVTALMLIAPYLDEGLKIELIEKPVSFTYVQMTENLMKHCGVRIIIKDNFINIESGSYVITDSHIEPDWSSASYWYEIVALSDDAEIFLPGFGKDSAQGDKICVDLFNQLGVITKYEKTGIRLKSSGKFLKKFEFDFTNHPDLVPAVIATCAAKQIKASFFGIGHLKYKESDRIKSLSRELSKIGANIKFSDNKITLVPPKSIKQNQKLGFDTHADHRIAMCLAPLVLKFKTVTINDPVVVSKSYPGFWRDIKRIGFTDVEKNTSDL